MEQTLRFINIPAQDLLPLPKPFETRVLIASAYASSSTFHNEDGNVLSPDEGTKWTSEGDNEHVFLELSEYSMVTRMEIEWDPTLPRTGTFSIDFIEETATRDTDAKVKSTPLIAQDRSMFTVIEDPLGIASRYIKINVSGNSETDKRNGITSIKLWGRE